MTNVWGAVASPQLGTPPVLGISPDGDVWSPQVVSPFVAGTDPTTMICNSADLSLWLIAGTHSGGPVLVSSPDLSTGSFTTQSLSGVFSAGDIIHGGVWAHSLSLFVIVGGGSGGAGTIATSPDGAAWTQRSNPFNDGGRCYGIGWNETGGLLVAVGTNAAGTIEIATSTNGTTWSAATTPAPFTTGTFPVGVCWSSDLSLWACVSSNATQVVATSSDGLTWTLQTTPLDGAGLLNAITAGDSRFVAVGNDDAYDHWVLTSPSPGTTWTEQTSDGSDYSSATAIAYNGSQFVMGFSPYYPSEPSTLQRSTDGAAWTDASSDPFQGSSVISSMGGFAWGAGVVPAPPSVNAAVTATVKVVATASTFGVMPTPSPTPGPSGLHDYEVIVCDKYGVAKGQIASAVPTQIDWDLDAVGQALIDIWILDPTAALLPVSAIPGALEVQIWRDQVLIWWGIPVSASFDATQVHITCNVHLWWLANLNFGPYTTNFLVNPSFEQGLASWTATDVFANPTTQTVLLGTQAVALAAAPGSTGYIEQLVPFDTFSIGAGADAVYFDIAAWVFLYPGFDVTDEFQAGLWAQGSEGLSFVGTPAYQAITASTPGGTWTRFEVTLILPVGFNGDVHVRLYAPGGGTPAGCVWDACTMRLEESVDSPIPPGGSPGDNSDLAGLVNNIMSYAQNPQAGKADLAIRSPIGSSVYPYVVSAATGILLARSYQFSDNSGILDALNEFPSDGLVDFEIMFDATGHFRWLQLFTPAKGQIQYNWPVEIDLGQTTDLEGTVDGSQVGTAQRVLGQGSTDAAQEEGYASFASFLGGRVSGGASATQGDTHVFTASAFFQASDVGQAIYSLNGAFPVGSTIAVVNSSTEVTLGTNWLGVQCVVAFDLSDDIIGVGGIIVDRVQSALPSQTIGSLQSSAEAALLQALQAQPLPSSKFRADGPHGMFGMVSTGDVVPVNFNYGWLTFGPVLMRISSISLYPPTEEMSLALMQTPV